MKRTTIVLALCGLVACGTEPASGPSSGANEGVKAQEPSAAADAPDDEPEPAAGGAEDPVAAMNAAIAELEARPERDAKNVKVQHILISFGGAGTRATRPKKEAEALAADVYAQIVAGADFDALVTKHTDDSPPGIYAMTTGAASGGVHARTGMVPAFGNVGWRLDVGEIGIAPHHPTKSPYGWHIVKRLE